VGDAFMGVLPWLLIYASYKHVCHIYLALKRWDTVANLYVPDKLILRHRLFLVFRLLIKTNSASHCTLGRQPVGDREGGEPVSHKNPVEAAFSATTITG